MQIPTIEETLIINDENLVQIKYIKVPYFNIDYHSHPQYELTYILKGYGKRHIEGIVQNFDAPELVLLDKNVKHFWECDAIYHQGHSKLEAESIVMHFDELLLERLSYIIPNGCALLEFVKNIKQVLVFDNDTKLKIKPLLLGSLNKEGFEKMSIILQIFHIISQNNVISRDNIHSAIAPYTIQSKENNTKRMTNIIEFTRKNFRNKISIEEVSAVANLCPSAFCRYFKKEKDKNYTDYVNELRIMYASDLLKNTEISVTQIAYESGFENPCHFFSLFKKITKKTPLQYRKIQTEVNLK